MRIINIKDSKYGDFLRLGASSNFGLHKQTALFKARIWAPKGAESFNIEFVNYHEIRSEVGNFHVVDATIEVTYFTTREEGKFRVYKHYETRKSPNDYISFGNFKPHQVRERGKQLGINHA